MTDYKVGVGKKSRKDRMDELGGSRRPRTGEKKAMMAGIVAARSWKEESLSRVGTFEVVSSEAEPLQVVKNPE